MKRNLLATILPILLFAGGLVAGIALRYHNIPQASAQTGATRANTPADLAWDDAAPKQIAVETLELEAALALLKREEPKPNRQLLFDLVEAYRQGTQSPEAVKGLLAKSLNSFHFQKAGAKSAAQVSQAAAEAGVQ